MKYRWTELTELRDLRCKTVLRQCVRRLVQLCACHRDARECLYEQARRKDKDFLATLATMERTCPAEFAEHVANFCETCQTAINVIFLGGGSDQDLRDCCKSGQTASDISLHCLRLYVSSTNQGALGLDGAKQELFGISLGFPSFGSQATWMKVR